jgi:hypothetical protein
MGKNNGMRDREIFAAFKAGHTPESLAGKYNLRGDRIRVILMAETHKHATSPEEPYRTLSQQVIGDPRSEGNGSTPSIFLSQGYPKAPPN